MSKKPVALVIMDGFGMGKHDEGDAIFAANTPNIDQYWNNYPHNTIHASGLSVGLPEGQMGNSEVGHLNLGAGRIVYQEYTRISKAINDGDFFGNVAFLKAIQKVKQHNSKLHLMGLLSDGGVHSHNTHLYALIELAKQQGLDNIYIHGFMDGRDVPPSSGGDYVKALENVMAQKEFGKIATIMGRYYAMDRDKRWERVKKAYEAMALGKGESAASGTAIMEASYANGVTDEFVIPSVVMEDGEPVAKIEANDAVIFFNFRPDRAREITETFIKKDFNGFNRENGYFDVFFVSMTQYDETFKNITVAHAPQTLENTFGEYIAKNGKKQLRIAETEKYAHVTFFFNGGVEEPNKGEDRALVSSPKVATYDLQPAMSAIEVTDEAVKRIESGEYDAIILNFANCDMVGHTGVFEAAVEAVETVDTCVGRVVEALKKQNGVVMITADHGNAEKMIDEVNGGPFTAHTTLDVPFIYINEHNADCIVRDGGRLCDIAPTMLKEMNLPVPKEMTGKSLV
jgi:2,3-bisphosphoglycerate-independent phosphoglycerate mutase